MFRFFQKIYLKLQNEVCCEVYCGVSIFFQKKHLNLSGSEEVWFNSSSMDIGLCGGEHMSRKISHDQINRGGRGNACTRNIIGLSRFGTSVRFIVSNRYGSLPLVFTVLFALSMIRFSPTLELLSPLSALQELCV